MTLIFSVVGILCGLVIVEFIYSQYRVHKVSSILFAAAIDFRITYKENSIFKIPSLSGRIGSFPVFIELKRFLQPGILQFRIKINQRKDWSFFSISAENFFSQLDKLFGNNDILTGDEYFDNRALIEGSNSAELLILLNNEARSLIDTFITTAYSDNFRVDEDKIEYIISLKDIQSKKDIDWILKDLLTLAKIFCRKGSPAALLKENYLTEIDINVKKKILNSLCYLTASLPLDDPVVKDALKSNDYEIQLLGAKLLKEKGYEKLILLYKKGMKNIQQLILDYAKQEKISFFFDFFLESAKASTDIEERAELVDCFGLLGDAGAEQFLRNELNNAKDYIYNSEYLNYCLKIIGALKYCGTYDSIESLYNTRHYELEREADEAIAMIQNRIGSGDKGWLSMSPETGEKGKLSIIDEQGEEDK